MLTYYFPIYEAKKRMALIPVNKIKQAFPGIAWNADIIKNTEDLVRDPEYDGNEDVAMDAVRKDENAINFIKMPTKKLLRIAIINHPRSVIHISWVSDEQLEHVIYSDPIVLAEYEGFKSSRVLEKIVMRKPEAIGYFSTGKRYVDEKVIEKNGMALRFVELKYRTKRVCYKAVMQNPMAIAFVPPTILTDEFYISLIEKYPVYWKKVSMTQKNITEAVKVCPAIVENMILTESSALTLAKINYRVAEYYSFSIESLKILIKKRPETLLIVGVWYLGFKTELYDWAFALSYKNFMYMIDPSMEMCNAAINIDENMISYIAMPTSEMFRAAISKDQHIIMWCRPPAVSDLEWAVSTFPKCIAWVGQSEKLSLLAVNKDGLALQWIRKRNQTEAICKAAVKNNPLALRWAYCQTIEMCKNAVMHDPSLLRWVIDQTEDICKLAISKDPLVILWVHKSIFDDIIMMQKYDA